MKYQNPILRGFHPDPSICRNGKDYYLATSTFCYFPGIALHHSTDLLNWKRIGYALTNENFPEFFAADESGGIWAPTIRFNPYNDMYYIAVAIEGAGNCILHAKNPEGPWSKPVWVHSGGIDPSLLFENGECIYCVNAWENREKPVIVAARINPDTGEILEPLRDLWNGTGGGWLEAPHLYHIGQYYYVFAAEGGTGMGHMENVARSVKLYGPYETCPENPVLTNRNDTAKKIHCTGHADIVQDIDGKWWMVHLGVRSGVLDLSQLGRETFLTPFSFSEGWPCLKGKMARLEEECPTAVRQYKGGMLEDDFTEETFPSFWQTVGRPSRDVFKRENGLLTVNPSRRHTDTSSYEMLLTVQPDFDFELMAEAGAPETNTVVSGVILYNTCSFWCFFGVRKEDEELEAVLWRKAGDFFEERVIEKKIPQTGKQALFIKGSREEYRFEILQADSTRYEAARISSWMFSGSLQKRPFTGTMAGVCAFREENGTEKGKFSKFKICY
jgi:xylan 1,4-beta-xylosidase